MPGRSGNWEKKEINRDSQASWLARTPAWESAVSVSG
jgi:hypothetical protein